MRITCSDTATVNDLQARLQPADVAATERFLEFAETWGRRYPAIVKLWENAWAEFAPFLAFDPEICRDLLHQRHQSVNARIRRGPRPRGTSPASRPR